MSRSNPTEASQHPCTRWMEWDGANGSLRYFNKETKSNVDIGSKFTFILLDQLSVIKGWHDASESGIYSNEIKDTLRDPLVVKAFKSNGPLAEGLYRQIKDRIAAVGGVFAFNLYVAYKDGDGELSLGSIMLKGGALREWMEFRNKHRDELYKKAVDFTGFTEGKKGKVTFRTPTFGIREITPETNEAAVKVDIILQKYLASYLKRPTAEQAGSTSAEPESTSSADHYDTPFPTQDEIDDIPF